MTEGKNHIVVAVDFGTTFSGVAWAQPDTQYLINQWPYSTSGVIDGKTSEKVPSELAFNYDGSTPIPIWGFQIPESMPRLQFIKLAFGPEKKLNLWKNMPIEHADVRRMDYPHHATPENAVTAYLRALLKHVSEVLKHKVGAAFESMTFTYVITVPAIWSDRAKVLSLDCAEKAGMGSSPIQIVSEPEAAAVHTLKVSNPHGMNVNDTIIICDAGGGTVDLITFTIVEFEPALRLKEAAPGTGGLCGSTYLNRAFENFLHRRLGSCEGWGCDTMEHAMQRFETIVKRQFAGDPKENFAFPVPGIADSKELGVRRGCLQVTGEEINKFCLPVLKSVVDLVEHQIKISRAPIKSLFLVGGFGQSPLLRLHIRKGLPSNIQILSPVDGWTAVVRGALSKTVSQICPSVPQVSVESRVARKSYGNTKRTKFNPFIHDRTKKYAYRLGFECSADIYRYWCAFHGDCRIGVMHWIIKKGDNIHESQPIVMKWHQRKEQLRGTFTGVKHRIYTMDNPDGTNPPMYYDSGTMEKHAVLHPELDPILRMRIPTVRGADMKEYYQVSYETHATYYSAHYEYSLWFEGKNHGAIKVDYV